MEREGGDYANHNHDCDLHSPPPPVPCSDNDLRTMRHKRGCKAVEGIIAHCPNCKKAYNSEALASKVINSSYDDVYVSPSPETKELDIKHRLDIIALRHVYDIDNSLSKKEREQRLFLINAFYNLHRSLHARSCFKCCDECRFDLPGPEVKRTILSFINNPQPWFNWVGETVNNSNFTVELKRHIFDAFMNVYNPATTFALGCNNNVAFGNIKRMFYSTTYNSKGTQEDDAEAFQRVARMVAKRIKNLQEENRNSEDIGEGISRLYGGIVTHCRSHIISAPLARYIVTNGSRFKFSHKFAYIPIFDFHKYVLGQKIQGTLKWHRKTYLERSLVFDYVYQPKALNKVSLWDFVKHYMVVPITENNKLDVLPFKDSHPCAKHFGVIEREISLVPDIPFGIIPDLANVGNILNDPSDMTHSQQYVRERYAAFIMILFYPFRTPEDVKQNGSFMKAYQDILNKNSYVFNAAIIQNIQNCHNALRVDRPVDPLIARTEKYGDDECNNGNNNEDTEDNVDIDMALLDHCNNDEEQDQFDNEEPMSLSWIQGNGKNNCGYDHIAQVDVSNDDNVFLFSNSEENTKSNRTNAPRDMVSQIGLIELSLKKESRRIKIENKIKEVECANGTTDSIEKWGIAYGLDMKQMGAFEVLCATFVMTYYNEAYVSSNANHMATGPRSMRQAFRLQKDSLQKMGAKEQLLMFMTGPGGSGKSRVIDALMHYCRSYCSELGTQFNDRTIVVTAMTGVAATSIQGETTCSATRLACERITSDHIDEWENTRLLIIDEISFAKEDDLIQLDRNLRQMRQQPHKIYGGMNILFAGDFHQLPPVKADPLYYSSFELWQGALNSFIELEGMHRFNDDPVWGERLERFRNGCPTNEDFDVINARLLNVVQDEIPIGTAYACYGNKERNSIHAGLFRKHIEETHYRDLTQLPPSHTVIIKGNLVWKSNNTSLSKQKARQIYKYCGDAFCKNKQGQRCDPYLCLYKGCRIMHNQNTDVGNGKANGTQCSFQGVMLKPHARLHYEIIDGYFVNAVHASDIEYIKCKFVDSKHSGEFQLKPEKRVFNVQVPFVDPEKRIDQKLQINQVSIILNSATTGHKLQGQTKHSLIASDWYYGNNWVYVVLSRVKTIKGLFLREELDRTKDFSVDTRLLRHEQWLRTHLTLRN